MKEEFTLELETSAGTKKEFSFEVDKKTIEKIKQLNKPISIIKSGTKGILKTSLFLFLIASINLAWLTYSLFDLSEKPWYTPLVILLLGIIFTGLYAYKAYRYITFNFYLEISKGLAPVFKKICDITVFQVHNKIQNHEKINTASVNIHSIVNKFDNLPGIAKKVILFFLNRLPFFEFVNQSLEVIKSGNNEKASELIYTKTSDFISNRTKKNTLNWLFWFIPLNIVVLILAIKLIK